MTRFHIDIHKLVAYGIAASSDNAAVISAVDIIEPVVVKATSKALQSTPGVCGHAINGVVYACHGGDVDLMTTSLNQNTEPIVLPVEAAFKQTLDSISTRIRQAKSITQEERIYGSALQRIFSLVFFLSYFISFLL